MVVFLKPDLVLKALELMVFFNDFFFLFIVIYIFSIISYLIYI